MALPPHLNRPQPSQGDAVEKAVSLLTHEQITTTLQGQGDQGLPTAW
jgi:hypothetical protein